MCGSRKQLIPALLKRYIKGLGFLGCLSKNVKDLYNLWLMIKLENILKFFQLYGAGTMNNTLCLGIFAALVYFRDLKWYYSAGE